MSGDKAVLHCPIQPGALLQQYSVIWTKGSTLIAQVTSPPGQLKHSDPRYQIDSGSYSLIINSVTVNDTSSDYQCEIFVTIPITNAKHMLQASSQVALSLNIIGRYPANFGLVQTAWFTVLCMLSFYNQKC